MAPSLPSAAFALLMTGGPSPYIGRPAANAGGGRVPLVKPSAHSFQVQSVTPALPRIAIEVVSDVVCPYCLIGKVRLERAMKAFKDRASFQIKWSPYILNLDINPPIPVIEHYQRRFGSERAAKLIPEIQDLFASEGLDFRLDNTVGDTKTSHRLLSWVGREYGFVKQNALMEELFMLYFSEAKDVTDVDVLADAASKVGVPDPREFLLDEQRGLVEVKSELLRTQVARAVPHFIVDGQYSLVGMKDPAVFTKIFEGILNPDR